MKKKYCVELPKYRLQLHVKLIKRRKPLLAEPILPKPSVVKRKYRKGTFIARFARYMVDHKKIKSFFAANFALIAIATSFIPQASEAQAQGTESAVIESQTKLITQNSMEYPLDMIRVNQNYSVFHKAIDFGGELGTAVKPIMDGIVAYAGWDRTGYGNLVVLEHKNGIDSYYAHLSKITVTTGQTVATNSTIGLMGATGRSTGVHLHLEIHQNGISINPLLVLSK